jgi:hypothetical protein
MGPWFVPPLAEQDREFHEQGIIGAQNWNKQAHLLRQYCINSNSYA